MMHHNAPLIVERSLNAAPMLRHRTPLFRSLARLLARPARPAPVLMRPSVHYEQWRAPFLGRAL